MGLSRDERDALRDLIRERRPPAPPPPSGPTPEEIAAREATLQALNEQQRERLRSILRNWWQVYLSGEAAYKQGFYHAGIVGFNDARMAIKDVETLLDHAVCREIEAEARAEFAAAKTPAPIVAPAQAEAPTPTAEVPARAKAKRETAA